MLTIAPRAATTTPQASPPASADIVLYVRPEGDANGPVRQFVFDADLGAVAGVRFLDLVADGQQTVTTDPRGWEASKDGAVPAPVAAFNDAYNAVAGKLLQVEGNLEPGVVELLGMALVQPGAMQDFLSSFPVGTYALGANIGTTAIGHWGTIDTAPQAIKDVVAAADALRTGLPKGE